MNSSFDQADFETFVDKIRYVPSTDPSICIFSLGGFTESVRKNPGKCTLIDIDDMY